MKFENGMVVMMFLVVIGLLAPIILPKSFLSGFGGVFILIMLLVTVLMIVFLTLREITREKYEELV